jgi:hypothetical protein
MNLQIADTISPDTNTADTGSPAGTLNGRNYWAWTADGITYYLFWFSVHHTSWILSSILGALSLSGYWIGPNTTSPCGTYIGGTGVEIGNANVQELTPPAVNGLQSKVILATAIGIGF